MKFFKHSAAFVLGFFLIAGAAFAQGQQMQQQQQQQIDPDSITDEELEKVAAVAQEIQQIQGELRQQMQSEVKSALSDKEMNEQRFREIMMSQQNPQSSDSVNVTAEEQETIKEIQPQLMKIQQSSQKQMMGAMQENEVNPQRFQAIMQAVQSNPEVMKRFQSVMQDSAQN